MNKPQLTAYTHNLDIIPFDNVEAVSGDIVNAIPEIQIILTNKESINLINGAAETFLAEYNEYLFFQEAVVGVDEYVKARDITETPTKKKGNQ